MSDCYVAAIQMTSKDDLMKNLEQAQALLQQAKQRGAMLAVLPENFAMFAAGQQLATAEKLSYIQTWLSEQAQQHNLWIVGGSVPCRYRPNGDFVIDHKVRASCFVYDPNGQLCGRYDKIHLFDASIADKQASYQESATFEAGDELVIVDTPFAKIGITICYDVRFPTLYQQLREKGADIIVVPAAFTSLTGQAHWQVLLRARAIENQCFIVGAGQCGQHSINRQTWGHSQIIDPWGQVLDELADQCGVVVSRCDMQELRRIREQMPILRHRRLCES